MCRCMRRRLFRCHQNDIELGMCLEVLGVIKRRFRDDGAQRCSRAPTAPALKTRFSDHYRPATILVSPMWPQQIGIHLR